ncbi:MAG: carboxymuconolactone decarboxylase family protein [Planctomycetaceae bacterium]
MRIPSITEAAASEKVAQTFGRLRELLEVEELPEPLLAYGHVEAFLRDFFMNFKKFVIADGALDSKLKCAVALATAYQSKCDAWIDLLSARASRLGYSEAEQIELLAIVSTCTMYNAFFKFRDLSGSELFSGMGVGLRAHTFTGTSFDEKQVELINTVISDLNACRPCTSGHVDAARKLGYTDEQLLEAIQCAATVAAACQFTVVASGKPS